MNEPSIVSQNESRPLTRKTLRLENHHFRHTGGVSRNSRIRGFSPAFRDIKTGAVYLSRLADGRPAPVHVIDSLPDDMVYQRSQTGRVMALKETVIAGFERDGQFFTRTQAASLD